MRHANLILVLSFLGLFATRSGHAEQTCCVGSVAELRNALDQAEVEAQDSRIQVHVGTYNFTSELRFDPDLESTASC